VRDYIDSIQQLSHKQLVVMLARQRLASTQPIAVVGMAMRFPGGLDSPAALWEALLEPRVVFGPQPRVPVDSTGRPRWNLDAPDLAPYADLLTRGAYVADVDLFDADRYGIREQEALFLDPQQRLLVTCTAEALADAGLGDVCGLRTGVFTALSDVEYNYAAIRNGVGIEGLSAHMGPGSAASAAAGRIATCFRLVGPALTVDTACSSALTALHLAAAALRSGECDVAIVGASQLALAPGAFGVVARSGMLSPTGRARPFDAGADGYVRAEGCGVLVLRRQSDAANAYAAVRGTAVYQHGDRDSIAAVSAIGLSRVIQDALRAGDVAPQDVGFVEAQANGVRLSAVIEAEVLADAYGRKGTDGPPLPVGSAKANLGYLETVSGMASLMKAVLAVHHAEIPPQAGFDVADPTIAWDALSLVVPRAPTPWPGGAAGSGRPRRIAGVSSFGFTGTYCHALVESVTEGVPRPPRPATPRAGRSYWPESHRWS
jgi:acyl transferase domain-containing protein